VWCAFWDVVLIVAREDFRQKDGQANGVATQKMEAACLVTGTIMVLTVHMGHTLLLPRTRLARVIDEISRRWKQNIVQLFSVLVERPWW
jgi:hypothetical protein